jgi:hypothetical protein
MPNRRRHANVLPLVQITLWVLVCAFLGAAGLGYVSLKNQLHTGADEIVKLEREAAELDMKLSVVLTEIKNLTALDAIKRRYEADKTRLGGLVEIPSDKIVWVDRPLPVVHEVDAIRPTANASR